MTPLVLAESPLSHTWEINFKSVTCLIEQEDF